MYLRIVLADAAVFMARDDVFVQKAPGGHCSFALLTGNLETQFVGLICQIFAVSDIVDADRPEMTHSLLSHCQQLLAIFTKLHSFDGGRLFPCLDTFPCLCVP